jgi:uncharacterized membrane protein
LKKILSKVLILILLIVIFFGTQIVRADEENAENVETEQTTNENVENTEENTLTETTNNQPAEPISENQSPKKESIKARIIEAGKTYTRDNGNNGTETVQDIKVKILNGDKKDEKFDATYVLTYDIDNKIVGNKLREGNIVYVEITEENGEVKVIVQDVVRQKYLIGLVLFFFASIILVGRKKGIKAIIGLIITVLAIFFVLLTTIFKGYNAILVSVGTCFAITILTFAVIGGWNKKTISAALGTICGVVLAGIIATIVRIFSTIIRSWKRRSNNA